MEIYEFADKVIKDLSVKIESLLQHLVKAPSDRTAGKIEALSEARELIKNTRRTWTLREDAPEDL